MTNQAKNGTIKLDGETIKWVENFKYLGSMMLSSETDIKIRKGQAWGAFWKMKDIWKSIKISLILKINIFTIKLFYLLPFNTLLSISFNEHPVALPTITGILSGYFSLILCDSIYFLSNSVLI